MVVILKRKRGDAEACRSGEANAHKSAVERHLLPQAYTTVLTLREYALLKLPSISRLRRKKLTVLGRGDGTTDCERQISHFLDSTLVCSCNAVRPNDDATLEQWLSFSQKGDDSRVTLSGGIPDAANTQAEIMLDLLTEWSIFVAVDAGLGNYYQLSGELWRSTWLLRGLCSIDTDEAKAFHYPSYAPEAALRDLVRSVVLRILSSSEAESCTVDRHLQPGAAFSTATSIFVGADLYVLNRCSWSKDRQDKSSSQLDTAKLMMYMFPRQFGLHNVFTSDVNSAETAQKFQDYTLREEEVARKLLKDRKTVSADGTPKVPKRLRGMAWALVQRLQALHSRCSYTELLKHYCSSSKLADVGQMPRTISGEAAFRKQISQRPKSAIDRAAHPAESEVQSDKLGSLPRRHEGFQVESLVDLATSQSQVSSFCQAVLSRIVPNDFWGQGETMTHNKTAVLRQVDCFVRLRRFESFSLHEIVQGLRVADIAWLQPPGQPNQKASQSDMKKRQEIFHELLYFVFDSLLMPLIKSNFYVTEASTHRNRIFYYRHDIWRAIAAPAISVLKRDMFDEVGLTQANDILDTRRLGFSAVRLLPKGNKLRPIMNLRRRQVSRAGSRSMLGPSINSVLSPIHTALRFEKDANPHRLGSTLFSVNDMYTRLKGFKQAIGTTATTKLYFAKVDVQSAFDTIPQANLVRLMQSIPSQSKYTIIKHAEVRPGEPVTIGSRRTRSKALRTWRALVLAAEQDDAAAAAFTARLQNGLASKKRDTVFIDGVAQRGHDTGALLHLMADHIQRNMVRFGKRYYRQRRGIPQGSVLSSFLCNYFYADLETKHLGFLSGPDCLLMRLTDDFLLITLDKQKAVRFVETMHRGLPDYGVQVSPHKTMLNFPMSLHGEALQTSAPGAFPYCGTCIDDATLEITKDHQAAHSTAIANALTVEFSRSPGQSFSKKILNAFKIQSHLMFFDTAHNSRRTVLESLRRAFAETARKMVAYVRCLSRARRPRARLVIETIRQVADVASSILSSQSRRLRYPDYECTIRRGQVTRVAHAAFLQVLGKHQANYRVVIEWLQKQGSALAAV
ncbi:hypothetical protein E4U41_007160 [Claviceps citrina]|nr:hypothetical protein E4U41_007160 [Claviceps citrina]